MRRRLIWVCIICPYSIKRTLDVFVGAQWLSGRVLDSRRRGRGFEPHKCHWLSLNKHISPTLVLVQSMKNHPFITERLLMGRKESNQTNKICINISTMLHEESNYLSAPYDLGPTCKVLRT